jgi:hypothetical protein
MKTQTVIFGPYIQNVEKGGKTKVGGNFTLDKYFCPKLKNTKLSFFEKNIFLFFQSFQNPAA